MTSLSRTPAMAKAAPPIGGVGLVVGARQRPMATGSPVVPDVTCRRTRASGARAEVLAEAAAARPARGAQLRLGQQRDIFEPPRAGQPLAVEGELRSR